MTKSSRERVLARIAKDVLRIPTLKTRKCSLDFHEVAVWELKLALELAYKVGQREPVKSRSPSDREVTP